MRPKEGEKRFGKSMSAWYYNVDNCPQQTCQGLLHDFQNRSAIPKEAPERMGFHSTSTQRPGLSVVLLSIATNAELGRESQKMKARPGSAKAEQAKVDVVQNKRVRSGFQNGIFGVLGKVGILGHVYFGTPFGRLKAQHEGASKRVCLQHGMFGEISKVANGGKVHQNRANLCGCGCNFLGLRKHRGNLE